MNAPLHVAFHGLPHSTSVEELVEQQVERLERLAPKITSCRVVIQSDKHHRHSGNLYEVHVDLRIPGKEIVGGRHHPKGERHADVELAIRDAFKAVRRQLEEHTDRRRGHVKHHESHELEA